MKAMRHTPGRSPAVQRWAMTCAALVIWPSTASVSPRAMAVGQLTLLSPVNGARFAAGDTIDVSAGASFLNARNATVEFFANDQSLGIGSGNPATLAWTDVGVGVYRVVAEATIGSRRVRTAAATIQVVRSQPQLVGG